jgi:cytosine/adenosine deaminase-related metal-dependent hydrolase
MACTLIRNAILLTMEGGERDVIRGDIRIENDLITAIGDSLDPTGAQVIDGTASIVMPGLVNAHMHTWQTALRSVGSNWTLPEYFRWVHAGLATKFQPRDIYIGTLAGAMNQISLGTTTLVDWCHNNPTPDHTDAAIAALRETGIRAAFFHGTPKPDPRPGEAPYWEVPHPRSEVERIQREFEQDGGLLSLGLAVLGPHYATMDVTLQDFRLAREFGLIASMHQGGGQPRNSNGWAILRDAGLLGRFVNIVHGNDLADDLLAELVDQGVNFTITPESELISGHGHPIVGRLRDLGVSPSVGVDIESAHSGEMLTATRVALSHQRSLDSLAAKACGEFGGKCRLRARDALAWATIEGARMLGQEDRIGSLKVGKQADIVMLNADALNLQPVHDPISSVVMQANAANIDSVMIAGRWRKRAGKLLWDGAAAAIEELNNSGRRLRAEIGLQAEALS